MAKKAPVTPDVEEALKASVLRLKSLLHNRDFPDNERHQTAVTLHIVANGSRSKVIGPSATRALTAAQLRFQAILVNDQLPHEERALTDIILNLVTKAIVTLR